jgi:RNA polymerase sigma-70 factor (ECF subfamily)
VAQRIAAGDDIALLKRVADERSHAAFVALFEQFAPRIKTYLSRIGCSAAEAEELTQETMLVVWQRADAFDADKAAVSTWIFTIARNRRIDALRRKQLWQAEATVDIDEWQAFIPDPGYGTEELALINVGSERVLAQLQQLPANQQEVLRMAFLEEKTHQEISDELSVPLGTIKSRIRAALTQLQDFFGTAS